MSQTKEAQNKALAVEAFDTLFNMRDFAAAERFWSPQYIQHSAHIPPGREGLFELVNASPPTLKYEPGLVMAEGDFVILHGRFSRFGLPVNWVVADIVRIERGVLVEHWDVIQDEATEEQSKSRKADVRRLVSGVLMRKPCSTGPRNASRFCRPTALRGLLRRHGQEHRAMVI